MLQKESKSTLNAMILVTLKNLLFSQILPHHRQMAESDSQVSIFNQRKTREKRDPEALKGGGRNSPYPQGEMA